MSKPKWLTDETWICTNHVPASRFPTMQQTCWYCGEERPLLEGRVVRPVALPGLPPSRVAVRAAVKSQIAGNNLVGTVPCSGPNCANKAAGGNKYCSRACSNNNARARLAARKKATSISGLQKIFPAPYIPLQVSSYEEIQKAVGATSEPSKDPVGE